MIVAGLDLKAWLQEWQLEDLYEELDELGCEEPEDLLDLLEEEFEEMECSIAVKIQLAKAIAHLDNETQLTQVIPL